MPGELQVKGLDGATTTLTRNEASVAEKSLGVYMAPDGNTECQVEYLKEKASKFAKQVKAGSPATRNDIWKAFALTIRPTMHYCMSATTIEPDDWEDISWIINKDTLPRAGIVRTLKKEVLYGPSKYQGLGAHNFHYRQEITHLKDFVEQVNPDTSCGTRVQITVEALRMETGCPGNITDMSYSAFSGCTTDT